jgi:hypothetical protein
MKKVNYRKWQCLECGTTHETLPWKTGMFCDNACQRKFQRKERIAQWLNEGIDWKNNRRVPDWARQHITERDGHKCSVCGINTWNSKSIVFEIEHKDGNSENNLENNLCLICPNCHSQTDTYKNKNKGKGRHFRRVRYAEGKSF